VAIGLAIPFPIGGAEVLQSYIPTSEEKKKMKFIRLNVITMNMTIYNIKQSQVARKP